MGRFCRRFPTLRGDTRCRSQGEPTVDITNMLTPTSDCIGTLREYDDPVGSGVVIRGLDCMDELPDATLARLRDVLSPATPDTDRCRSILANLIGPFVGECRHELARHLHREFGSVNAVLAAHPSRLRRQLPQHPAAVEQIRRVASTMSHCFRLKIRKPTGTLPGRTLIEYLRHRIGFEPIEVIYALYFARNGELINDHVISRGTVDRCSIYPNEIARDALDVGANSVIIAHNHPGGDPTPSGADKELTRSISRVCHALNVHLNDHIVIGRPGFASFRELGLL